MIIMIIAQGLGGKVATVYWGGGINGYCWFWELYWFQLVCSVVALRNLGIAGLNYSLKTFGHCRCLICK